MPSRSRGGEKTTKCTDGRTAAEECDSRRHVSDGVVKRDDKRYIQTQSGIGGVAVTD